MLDGLDEVDWRRLGHAYGSAGDVPGQLRALRSPDPEVRGEALGELYANILHQGSRFEATAHAVPFLLDLLADPATPDRDALLALLAALAVGYDESWLPEGFPVAEFRRVAEGGRELLAAKPPPWDGDDESDKEYVEYAYVESLSAEDQRRFWAHIELAAYDAVRTGVPLFRALLDDADPGLRAGAAYLLGWFPEDAAGSLPALLAVAAGEAEAGVAGTALVSVGLLGAAPDVELLADPRPEVRWAAAVGRARVLGAAADEATVEELLSWTAMADAGREPADDAGYAPEAPLPAPAELSAPLPAAGLSAPLPAAGLPVSLPAAGLPVSLPATTGQAAAVPEAAAVSAALSATTGAAVVPFHGGDLPGYAALALRQLGPGHADRAFDALLDRLPAVTGVEALPVTTEALALAFPDGQLPDGTPPEALTSRQRRLAEVLARSPETWQLDGHPFGNFAMLVGDHGLPRTHNALRTYLNTPTDT
ncbi:hypothetical protein [Micromonospora sp. NPDC047074]|uniref:hypothetical protein n=1 Tax=Micromonospora sp. NPDC047074 TaxID=3154339 RepID=UPI0033FF4FFD